MKILTLIMRLFLGAIFVVFGLNGLWQFIDIPQPEGLAADFMNVLYASGYMKVVKVLEIIGGLLLLSGKKQALALCILAPIIVNILLYHLLLEPYGLIVALALVIAAGFLFFVHRASFAVIFKA